MDEWIKKEYDFFMRAAAMFESRAVEFAPLADDSRGGPIFRQAIDDAEHARTLAKCMADGYVLVNRDRLPVVEAQEPLVSSEVPDKYRS